MPDDLASVRDEFPDWQVEAVWIDTGAGPGFGALAARKDGTKLRARSRAELAEAIRREEGSHDS